MAETLIGESAGARDTAESEPPDAEGDAKAEDRPRRGPRSGRAIAEADAETAFEDGVPVTRIPEVRRRKRA